MRRARKAAVSSSKTTSRRSFLGTALSAGVGFSIVPRHVLGGLGFTPPSDMVTAACVGVGAQGVRVMMDFMKEPDVRIVAVCDVNRESGDYSEWAPNEIRNKQRALLNEPSWGSGWTGAVAGREPAKRLVDAYYSKARSGSGGGCTGFSDYRELLAKTSDLDAVVVGTPDHWHSAVSIHSLEKGKHVFCQKPMSHTVAQAGRMAEAARKSGLATQVAVGNQASEATRQLCEWVWAGAIGPVREVHNWSSRPFWPQGLERPKDAETVPDGLDWDLWLGPAPERPFNHVYLPFVWRGWHDFGCGAIGDMGNYSFDTLFRVLKLGAPETVEASSSTPFPETFPAASMIHFHFGARGEMPPVDIHWYDGGLTPPRPQAMADDYPLTGEDHEGLLLLGDSGAILCGFNGSKPRLIPESRMRDFTPPPKTLPRSEGTYREWIEACKGGPAPGANFEFEAPVVETILLGNVALRAGVKLEWDAPAKTIKNQPSANRLLDPPGRDTFQVG